MNILVMAAQVMLSLSILVVLHELGHFFPAKWFGCRVEKFYLFFDPYFELFKKKIGETEWGIGWLPLGGYVKISGMIDESMDTEQMEGPPQPWEFRSKPAWQRLIIMLGGVTVNFILGFAIFIGSLWYYGVDYIPTSQVTEGIYADSLGQVLGLRTGDKVLAIDTVQLDKFGDQYVRGEVLLRGARDLSIIRDGQAMTITLPDSFQRNLTNKVYRKLPLYSLPLKPVADTVLEGSIAEKSGLQKGDVITSINGTPIKFQQDLRKYLASLSTNNISLIVLRNGQEKSLSATLDESKVLGFSPYLENQFTFTEEKYTLGEAIPTGFKNGVKSITDQFDAVGQMFDNKIKVRESVGSVFSMGEAFGSVWNWKRFWGLTGLLSLILAIMNLLPIPALDGGHVMFLLYEVITGRKPGDKFLQYATTAGTLFLITFMALVLLNDVLKMF